MRPMPFEAGDRFGRLLVLGPASRLGSKRRVDVRCDCGQTKAVRVELLQRGIRSCGCVRVEVSRARARRLFRRHGESGTPAAPRTVEYAAWQSMLRRCDPGSRKRAIYFERGITVCARWQASFEHFLADVGRRPGTGYSLDRINNDGHYEPGNVRWADIWTQRRNRRPAQRRLH